MSVQALGWVFSHSPTTGSDRLVLLSIANHAGHVETDDGVLWEAWPSVGLIAREAGLARPQTVRDALNRLVDAGHLERKVKGAPDDRIRADLRTNLYRVVRHDPPAIDPTGNVGSTPPSDPTGNVARPHVSALTTSRAARGKPSVEPSENRNDLVLVSDEHVDGAGASDPFDAFWACYPRRVGKQAARRAFAKALKLVTVDELLAGAARFAGDPNLPPAQFIPHPSTWLGDGRWADDPLPPRGRGDGPPARTNVTTDRSGPSGRVQM